MGNNGYFEKHYGQLVGYKVTQVALDDSDPNEEEWCGLVLTKGGVKKIAWILRDPEGNGSGFLDIVDV
jgi:hypothetical protein|tara:strand:+ start:967 stop:1170 length:204 start_codon:yes stop_codon:yes gene_type:complete